MMIPQRQSWMMMVRWNEVATVDVSGMAEQANVILLLGGFITFRFGHSESVTLFLFPFLRTI
ncbi:hypothetical protein F0L16_21115 [Photorhabdus heterorhabditis]|uniref:Uncharacterized protein n=1 Tax=Photorhabdus heterorhabditis TaxID=880156 RepID=A0A5B0VJJ2_9GAMM|nr:hypothetical protein F0L16_21115 [Photorhabdus heterorhabditis]